MTEPSTVEIPDAPQMPPSVVGFLTDLLGQATCFLEFGAGGSTVLAARIGVPDVISVESDAHFLEAVEARIGRLGGRTRHHPVHADIGRTGAWGRPVDSRRFRSWPDYAQSGFSVAADAGLEPDLVLVDGRFRVACVLATLLSARAGTVVLFDDYAARSKYHAVEEFCPARERIDRAAVFEVPSEIDAQGVAFALARFSVQPQA